MLSNVIQNNQMLLYILGWLRAIIKKLIRSKQPKQIVETVEN